MRHFVCFSFLFLFALTVQAQGIPNRVTPADHRMSAFEQREALIENSLVSALPFENIGPSVQSGRVSDIAVNPADPSHFYVAYASGGLWKTHNNGTTFEPLFDNQAVITTGAVSVHWPSNTIWLGTGEVNSSRSSYAGLGMYRSTDGGTTWEHRGLGESHHIGRIIIHPDNPDVVWVAVLGHLYSANAERGIYKTTDGGASWTKSLFSNNNAGGIEMVIDPKNPDHLYAATWERTRRAWNFVESGQGSGIYESTDGGNNWSLITNKKNGFPMGEGAGRIGLAMTYDGDTPLLYASIDNYDRREKEAADDEGVSKDQLRTISAGAFAQLDDQLLQDYLDDNGFPEKYDAAKVKKMVSSGDITPLSLVEFTESANSLLFDTPVKGLEVYKLNGSNGNWTKTHEDYIEGVYYSYGYYFGQIRVSPNDPNRLYVMGVPVLRSDDGGANWQGINAANVHSDHHALWMNPDRPGHIILGNDGGINISYDDGENWIKCNHPPLGQFYYIAVDNAKPYRVYGGLQDNGVWMGEHTYQASPRWQQSGHYGYEMIMGGDGMQVAIDPRDNETVYTGFQFGNYFRIHTPSSSREYITPSHDLGERPYRWNWQTPIHLSEHNPDILYMGSNFVHRSMNQGQDFTKISDDLTLGGQKGDVPYGTLSAIHESPLRFGLLYAGSDDGLLHVSKDGGHSWQKISQDLPADMWISRVQASQHEEGRVYVTLNGYRWDHWNAMIYRSDDYGQSWEEIGNNLPKEPLNVVKEDPKNEDIVYVGSDHAAYISFDGGYNFMAFAEGLAGAPVHDIVIHPTADDILLGTHGRSIYRASASQIQAMTPELLAEGVHLFDIDSQRRGRSWGNANWYRDNQPKMMIPIYAKEAGTANFTLSAGDDGPKLNSFSTEVKKGLNFIPYDFTYTKDAWTNYKQYLTDQLEDGDSLPSMETADDGRYYLHAGTYKLSVKHAKAESETMFKLK